MPPPVKGRKEFTRQKEGHQMHESGLADCKLDTKCGEYPLLPKSDYG